MPTDTVWILVSVPKGTQYASNSVDVKADISKKFGFNIFRNLTFDPL